MGNSLFLFLSAFVLCDQRNLFIFIWDCGGTSSLIWCFSFIFVLITIPVPTKHYYYIKIQILRVFLRIRCVPNRAAVCRHPMTSGIPSNVFCSLLGTVPIVPITMGMISVQTLWIPPPHLTSQWTIPIELFILFRVHYTFNINLCTPCN